MKLEMIGKEMLDFLHNDATEDFLISLVEGYPLEHIVNESLAVLQEKFDSNYYIDNGLVKKKKHEDTK